MTGGENRNTETQKASDNYKEMRDEATKIDIEAGETQIPSCEKFHRKFTRHLTKVYEAQDRKANDI